MGSFKLDSLTAVQVAELLDVSDRAVRKWVKEKKLPTKGGDGVMTFSWPAVLAWYLAQGRNELGTGGTAVKKTEVDEPVVPLEDYDGALARKTRAEADLKELQLAERRGQVASIEDVEKILAASNLATKTQVEALPSLLATQLVGVPDRNTIHKLLTVETQQLLTNLASIDAVREAATHAGGGDD